MLIDKDKQISLIKTLYQEESMPHAMLFSGPAGVGKFSFALSAAYWLQGEKKEEFREAEKNAVLKHPDILTREQPLSIEQARDIKSSISTAPYSGEYKIVILNQAEKMSLQAANSLLKTIEEPRGDVVFILVSSYSSLILPTIKSRCYEIKFNYASDDIIRKKIDTGAIEEIYAHWSGRPFYAEMFLNNHTLCSEVNKIKQDCEEFLESGLGIRFNIIEKYVKIENNGWDILRVLEIWMEHIRDRGYSEDLTRRLLRLHRNLATTNANAKYLLNNFAVQTSNLQQGR